MSSDVVISGIGVTSGLGTGPEETLAALRRGQAAFEPVGAFDGTRYEVNAGAEARSPEECYPGFDLGHRADRTVRHLIGTIHAALQDARFEASLPGPRDRREALLGSTLIGMLSGGDFVRAEVEHPDEVPPYRKLAEWLSDVVAARVAQRFDLGGPCQFVSNACASGSASMAIALDRLRAGETDLVISGGFDPMCEYTYAGFGSLLLVSKSGCRPYQHEREGLLLGEGYGICVLERRDDAERRGARIRAVLAGASSTSDGFHLTQPDPNGAGAARCIREALADGGLEPGDVDHINLHGTGTPFNDLSEFRALKSVFGERLAQIPATANKSYVGHTLGGAGAVEAVLSILTMESGFVPPTLNVDRQDPDTAGLDLVVGEGREGDFRCVLSNSFGFGGANAAMVLTRP